MVSVLHEKNKIRDGKAQLQEVGGYAAKDQQQIMNKPSWISPHEVLQPRLINTVYHLLVKNNKG